MTNENRQTIRRAKHGKENPYFLMVRATAQDKTLSYEARGLMAYLLSQPGHWEVRVDDLILSAIGTEPTKAGKTKIYSILNELAEHRYIKKPTRYRSDRGRWEWTPYEVYERPYPDLPDMDEPEPDEPEPVLPDILESSESESTEKENREEDSAAEAAPPAAAFKAYETNIGLLTPHIHDSIKAWLEDVPTEWVIEALNLAVEYNRRSWAYAEAILKRWQAQGKDDGRLDKKPAASTPRRGMSPPVEEEDVKPMTPEQFRALKAQMKDASHD